MSKKPLYSPILRSEDDLAINFHGKLVVCSRPGGLHSWVFFIKGMKIYTINTPVPNHHFTTFLIQGLQPKTIESMYFWVCTPPRDHQEKTHVDQGIPISLHLTLLLGGGPATQSILWIVMCTKWRQWQPQESSWNLESAWPFPHLAGLFRSKNWPQHEP